MGFIALDVETANARMRSICQVGIVVFEDGREVAAESILIDPGEEFDGMSISIHGIEERHVVGAKKFPQIMDWLVSHIGGQTVVSHTHFDRTSIHQATLHHSLLPTACSWLDSAKVARRAWPQFAKSGYGLSNLAREFGISFQHHDALHDARTAGIVLLRAMEETGLDVQQWIQRCNAGISGNPSGRERREGDGEGPLLGEVIVFTGTLALPRREAADMAHVAGGRVDPGVTRETTMLVVGDQDIDRLSGATKSSKHRKAEQLSAAGQQIRFLVESDFHALVATA